MNEQELIIYNKGIVEGRKHAEPSPTTLKQMEELRANNEVIIERIENVKRLVEDSREENRKGHNDIKERQDHTNGNVTNLQKWKAYLVGAWTVIAFTSTVLLPILGYYFMTTIRYQMREEIEINVDKRISDFSNKNFDTYNK